jgi:type VI secretion system VasD/TssJ family lipoprotein
MKYKKFTFIKKIFIPLLCLLFIFCGKKPDPIPEWNFERGGIDIRYVADSMLNNVDSYPHTVIVVIYQLSSNNVFNDLTKNENGLKKLLLSERFDTSVVGVNRIIVQPSERNHLIIDRSENAKWIGIVTGYYNLVSEQVSIMVQIPYEITKKGKIIKQKTAKIEPLTLYLLLGQNSINLLGKS